MTELGVRLSRLSPARRKLVESMLRADAEGLAAGLETAGAWAIIGLSCRFPGAENATAFWDLLRDGRDAITEVPADRWDSLRFYDPEQQAAGKLVSRYGGFLTDVAGFDAEFFGITPREAAMMDPQHRILAETAWEAVQDAGIDAGRLAGTRTGVFVGISNSDYAGRSFGHYRLIDTHSATGNAHSVAANRLSYLWDLRGPSVAVDTACSSSLVALHYALGSLAAGESDLAIVGGVNLILSPSVGISFSRAGGMAPDGRCKAFADNADGMVRSEGCGVVIVKDLEAAIRDGDAIRAVVRGSAVNSDGRTNGLTAPSRSAQVEVISRALDVAGTTPDVVQYIEAHGTGTLLGDMIEAEALGAVLRSAARRGAPCAVGSVKSNIGHLESAAGMASVIKVVLAIQHREIPRTLHAETVSTRIPFSDLGLAVQQEHGPWPRPDAPLTAGISSFGFGGTNAHVVVTEPPRQTLAPAPDGPYLLTVSAPAEEELNGIAGDYGALLAGGPVPAGHVCAASALRRTHHRVRLAVVGSDAEELAARLERFTATGISPGVARTRRPADGRVAFAFSGFGGRTWRPAGRDLRAREPVFAVAFRECEEAFVTLGAPSLDIACDPEPSVLARQMWSFTVQVALFRLWESWGVRPSYVYGHSMGEVAAAHCAGALTLGQACRVLIERGRRIEEITDGRMVAVEASRAEVERALALASGTEIAAENSPTSYVLGGTAEAVAELIRSWEGSGAVRAIAGRGLSHCAGVEPRDRQLAEALADLRPRHTRVPFLSTVTGTQLDGARLDGAYWGRNFREQVRFAGATRLLLDQGVRTFLEIAATPSLVPPIGQTAADQEIEVTIAPSLRPDTDEREQLLRALAAVHVQGVNPDFAAIYGPLAPHVTLPVRAWRHTRHWIDLPEEGTAHVTDTRPEAGPQAPADADAVAPVPPSPARAPAGDPQDLAEEVVSTIAAALGLRPEAVDPSRSPLELGMDSILAVEIRTALARRAGIRLPLREMLTGATVSDLIELARADRENGGDNSAPRPSAEPDFAEFPLSAGQRALWFLQQASPGATPYNVGDAVRILGPLDVDWLRTAFGQIIDHHPSLRSTFHEADGEPVRRVVPRDDSFFEVADASALTDEQLGDQIADLIGAPFDLRRPSLFRVVVYQRADDDHVIVLVIHHLIADFWSLGVILSELDALYAARSADIARAPVGYSSYVSWQRDLLASAQGARSLEFWRQRLSPDYPPAEIAAARRPASAGYDGDEFTFTMSADTAARLRELATEHGTTTFVVVLAAFQLLLSRYCGAERFTIGTLTSGRNREEFHNLVGYLVNPVVIRATLAGDPSFAQLIDQARDESAAALQHADFPFPTLVEELRPPRDPGRSPFFQILFAWQRAQGRDDLTAFGVRDPAAALRLAGLDLDSFEVPHRTSQFDLSLFGGEVDGQIRFSIEYSTDLYPRSFVERLAGNFTAIVRRLSAAPGAPVSSADALSDEDRARSIAFGTGPDRSYPAACLHELVAEQVNRTPDAVAVSAAGDISLTYRQLATAADLLAAKLRRHGIGRGDRVGVFARRSAWLVAGLLAILECGAAYVPLDPDLPRPRIAFEVDDAAIGVALTDSACAADLEGLPVQALLADTTLAEGPGATRAAGAAGRDVHDVSVSREDAAYVIYTSGSAGAPKGVEVPHRGVVNRLLWMQEEYGLTAADVVLQKTPFTFDVSVWELFWPLMTGARLHLCEPGKHRDPRHLARLIEQQKVTTVHFVPSMLTAFLAEPQAAHVLSGGSPLRRVFTSGEPLAQETVREFLQAAADRGPELHNLYGPTEASIDVTYWHCGPEDSSGTVPIGRPVANTSLRLVDQYGSLAPTGIPAQLCIAGTQVALGYIGRPELTEEAFVPDVFGDRLMYRTGDIARYREDGAVEFLGRQDGQVKIRGFRVELGEIEAVLRAHPAVAQAAVVYRPAAARHALAGYVVPHRQAEADPVELTRYLAGRLPEYMIPGAIVPLAKLPLLSNGKLDRKALPEPPAGMATPAAPQSEQELLLAEVWEEVLGTSEFGVDDSFFALGGDSMLSIRARAGAERRGWTFALEDLLATPAIRQLAPRLTALGEVSGPASPAPLSLLRRQDLSGLPRGLDDAHPVSSMQAGMLAYAESAADSAAYRVVSSVKVALAYDDAALRQAILATFQRHPALRSAFAMTGFSEPLQLVYARAEPPLEVIDLRAEPTGQDDRVREWAQQAKQHVFTLSTPPLLAFTVHLLAAAAFQFSVVEHHAVLDGWSDGTMLAEILTRYQALLAGEELPYPPVPSSYPAYVAEERRVLADPGARAFWTAYLRGAESPALPRRTGGAGHLVLDVPVGAGLAERLRTLARDARLPVKALLTAAHGAALSLVCGSGEVVTGVVANGRLEHEGGDEVVGVFLNTVPQRLDLRGGSWLSLARRVFEHERASAPYRRYPIARIQRETGIQLDSYVNFVDFHLASGAGPVTEAWGIAETNFPLAANFIVDPVGGTLSLALDCDTSVLEEDLCRRLPRYYARALEAIADAPDGDVASVVLLSDEELDTLSAWQGKKIAYDASRTVHQRVEDQARQTPSSPALVFRNRVVTYAELDEQTNRLAHLLIARGVQRGTRVGICLRRGPELVIAMLAVLKAGGAYVPMDPGYPSGRLDFIASDAGLTCLITDEISQWRLTADLAVPASSVVLAGSGADDAPGLPVTAPDVTVGGTDPAYVMYTSGSTGQPKGTVVTHRNVGNFLVAMDDRVGCSPDEVVAAVTSVSFDISLLELIWPLTRGAQVVITGERIIEHLAPEDGRLPRPLDFSFFFFFAAATSDSERHEGYRLVREAASFADAHGFEAIWTPERHFHEFGGLYPNPAVMAAALATTTSRVALRCGSVVAPLHDSIRIAEEWSLVDNLSGGRVGLAFASGWNSNDFVFYPGDFADRRSRMAERLAEFRQLWRGGTVRRTGGSGEQVDVRLFPSPVQPEPPVWLTSAGSTETFIRAGAMGVNVLTHLLGQDTDQLAAKISAYRDARALHGHEGSGRVSLMIHTFVHDNPEQARERARGPFREYLRTSTELWRVLFESTGQPLPETVSEEDLEAVLDQAVDRYFDHSGLFGSPDTCLSMLDRLSQAGVDEVACLIDFGVPADEVIGSFTVLDQLRKLHVERVIDAPYSLAELCRRHEVTMLQATPSFFTAVLAQQDAIAALRECRTVLVGGEAFPAGLADQLSAQLPGVRLLNMYGPTETTIWSTTHELDPAGHDRTGSTAVIPIGRPIANTDVLVLDERQRLVPVGVPGELWIGGDGVAREYLGRAGLTAERFTTPPGARGLMYRTGDRVCWRADGALEFLGRLDRQVKIRGHRVEPDEVENALSRHPQAAQVAVVTTSGAEHGVEIVAYVSPADRAADLRLDESHVRQWSQVWDGAYADGGEFAGWIDSATGKPIPVEQMREWLDHTVARISALRPSDVVDVGVGTGLLLRALAPDCRSYLGIDVSEAAIAAAGASLTFPPAAHGVTLVTGDARQLSGLATGTADTVILNSVAQYFPDAAYLRLALREAARVAAAGTVFVGDVRALEVLDAFHAMVVFQQASPLTPAHEIAAEAARRLREERELCVSPALFRELGQEGDGFAESLIELKRGHSVNEVTRFRYDVTLLSSPAPRPARTVLMPWDDLDGTGQQQFDQVAALIADASDHACVTVTRVPNRRLMMPLALVRLLATVDPHTTAWDLERLLWDCGEDAAVDPETLAELGERLGREVRLIVPPGGNLSTFDAVFAAKET